MKILITSILVSVALGLYSQKNINGRYRDYFGSRIELHADGTFKYIWQVDLSGSWTKGTWFLKNDMVYFHMTPTYDTISYKKHDGTFVDKIILSVDETSERFTPEQYAGMGLSSGGQNLHPYPEKLFFKKGRLYTIYNGRRVVKKQKGWSNKKLNPWFFKSDD